MVAVSGAHAREFAVTTEPISPVAAFGGSTSFQVSFTPGSVGLRTATLTIARENNNENPYNFDVQGYGIDSLELNASYASEKEVPVTAGNYTAGREDVAHCAQLSARGGHRVEWW